MRIIGKEKKMKKSNYRGRKKMVREKKKEWRKEIE
jgi:hypothetical protein